MMQVCAMANRYNQCLAIATITSIIATGGKLLIGFHNKVPISFALYYLRESKESVQRFRRSKHSNKPEPVMRKRIEHIADQCRYLLYSTPEEQIEFPESNDVQTVKVYKSGDGIVTGKYLSSDKKVLYGRRWRFAGNYRYILRSFDEEVASVRCIPHVEIGGFDRRISSIIEMTGDVHELDLSIPILCRILGVEEIRVGGDLYSTLKDCKRMLPGKNYTEGGAFVICY